MRTDYNLFTLYARSMVKQKEVSMFPTELEITMQRREYEREAENYRLNKQLRESTGATSAAHRLSLWISARRPRRQPDCPGETSVAALQS